MSGSSAPVFRDGAPLRIAKPAIRLFLSGGGHRATIGSAGAICALVDLGNWNEVTEVISVSGGSVTNAALVRGHTSEHSRDLPTADDAKLVGDPRPALKDLIDRLLGDRASLVATPTRVAIMAFFVVSFALLALGFAAALGVGSLRLPTALVLLLGMSTPFVVVMLFRQGLGWLWSDIVKALVDGRKVALAPSNAPRRYLFCASGLSSGVPYYFWAQGDAPTVTWGELLQGGYSLHDAVLASTSLPGVGAVRAPSASRNEVLVDGGVSGIFGQQREVSFERHAKDAFRGEVQRVAIDAGRHSVAYKEGMSPLTRFSILFALSRWLKASLEATYINDLGDFKGGHLVRLCRDPSMPATAGVHGAALDRAREETSNLGLFGVNRATTVDALISGYVATRLAFQPSVASDDLQLGLTSAGTALGLGDSLTLRWQELSLLREVLDPACRSERTLWWGSKRSGDGAHQHREVP
jgi:hypothetical protein